MFNSNDYRAKAAAYQNRAKASHNADEIREYGKLERTFSELADNAAWMEQNLEKRIHPSDPRPITVKEEPKSNE
jgi:hypothetical protein